MFIVLAHEVLQTSTMFIVSVREVLQRSTMFIALHHPMPCAPAERYVINTRSSFYIPLLTERYRSGIWGYKHVAPTEQPRCR